MNIIVSTSKTCQNKPVRAVTGKHLTCCHGRCDSLLLVDRFLRNVPYHLPQDEGERGPSFVFHDPQINYVVCGSLVLPQLSVACAAAFTCVPFCRFTAVTMRHDGSLEKDPWRSDTHSSDPHGTQNAHLVEDISLTPKVEMRQDSSWASVGNR